MKQISLAATGFELVAATDLTAADVRGLLNSFDAVDATRADVCSFVGFLVAIFLPH